MTMLTPTAAPATPASTPVIPASDIAGSPAPTTGEQPQVETPSPVSAQTVRQRVLPDTYDDDLR